MNTVSYRKNILFIENVALDDIAAKYSTPVYLYSKKALIDSFFTYKQAFSELNPLFCYAVKANSNLSILQLFSQLGLGFDIVSGGELQRILTIQAQANNIVFSGVGKAKWEIEAALQAGIFCFNVESFSELMRLNNIARQLNKIAPLSIRVNPNIDAKTHPYISTGVKENKFGFDFEQAYIAYKQASQLKNLKILGIDCHIGSQITDLTPIILSIDKLLILVEQLKKEEIYLQHINIGGGIGICYKNETLPNLKELAKHLKKALQNHTLQLILEPGRSLVGQAGVLLTKIEYIKTSPHKNFVISDAAMNDLLRPSLYNAYHKILPTKQHSDLSPILMDIVGPICESSDFLGKERYLAVKEGDHLAILSVGAYGFTMSSHYNTRSRAAEVLVDDTKTQLIRHRETIDELLSNEKSCLFKNKLKGK